MMSDSQDIKDLVLGKAIDAVVEPASLSGEDIAQVMSDADAMQMAKDGMLCKKAMIEDSVKTNVDEAYDKFVSRMKKKENESEKVIKSSRFKKWMLGAGIGIAASVCLFFSYTALMKKEVEETVVFQAEKTAKVELTTEEGRTIALEASDKVKNEMLSLRTPAGETYKVTLSDGTEVWMNADSRLTYPSQFEGDVRKVKLQGEAYFKVTHDPQHPFIVEANGMETKVLGTEFNVSAYQNHAPVVTLIEGSVAVEGKSSQTVIAPGEEAILNSEGRIETHEVDTETATSWRDGYLYFDNKPLADIMQTIGRQYNVNVVFENDSAMRIKMHFFCECKGDLDECIERLNKMNYVEADIEGNTIRIK